MISMRLLIFEKKLKITCQETSQTFNTVSVIKDEPYCTHMHRSNNNKCLKISSAFLHVSITYLQCNTCSLIT